MRHYTSLTSVRRRLEMPLIRSQLAVAPSICLFLLGCSGGGGSPSAPVGEASGAGGTSVATGGSGVSVGGTIGSGGAGNTGPSSGGTIGGAPGAGGAANGGALSGGNSATGGKATGGNVSAGGGSTSTGGTAIGGANVAGGATGKGGSTTNTGGVVNSNGGAAIGGTATTTGGTSSTGGVTSKGGTTGTGGTTISTGGASATGGAAGSCSGPIGTFSGALATGINFLDTEGNRVNAHGGGIIQVGDTFYMHGEYFLSTTTDNNFNGFSMYSSKDLATWKNEGIILPQQASGELGPNRKGERPHIIKCPATGEFVLYAHAADVTYQADKEVVYATSATVNGQYSYKGPLTNASGAIAAHSDMGAFVDGSKAYVITESGHVYTLATDCHSWLSDTAVGVNCTSTGAESPAVFKSGSTYYWIGSNKTGWRANNNFYSTASSMTGPWTCQGYIAPVTDTANIISDERTWLSQSTWVQPVTGCNGTVFVYWGDHWDGTLDTTAPGKHNYLATYVFQPIVFSTSTKMLLPTYQANWKLDVGAGTWSP